MTSPSDPHSRVLELEELNARQAKVLEGLRAELGEVRAENARLRSLADALDAGARAVRDRADAAVAANTPLWAALFAAKEFLSRTAGSWAAPHSTLCYCMEDGGECPAPAIRAEAKGLLATVAAALETPRPPPSPASDKRDFRQPDEPFETPEQRKARGDAIQAFNEEQEANMYACITLGCDGGTRNAGDYCHECAAPQAGGSP